MRDLVDYAKICKESYSNYSKGAMYKHGSDVAYIFNRKGGKVIAIRGSDGNDMKSNFDFKKEDTPIGKVHHGFYTAMRGLLRNMSDGLKGCGREKIVITGHSRGGAIALLMAMYLKKIGFNVTLVYSYGAPRSLCKGTRSSVHHVRVVTKNDRVPKLPRRYMGYAHDCKPTLINTPWWSRVWILGYSNHMIDDYIEDIEKMI